jgi:hypothetical protein
MTDELCVTGGGLIDGRRLPSSRPVPLQSIRPRCIGRWVWIIVCHLMSWCLKASGGTSMWRSGSQLTTRVLESVFLLLTVERYYNHTIRSSTTALVFIQFFLVLIIGSTCTPRVWPSRGTSHSNYTTLQQQHQHGGLTSR